MKILPRFEYKGCALELSAIEAQQLSRICLHYNRSASKDDAFLDTSVKVMQGLDCASYLPGDIENQQED